MCIRDREKAGYGQSPLCYLCGKMPADTDDHVPPRGLFPRQAQFKGHQLPACRSCNELLTVDEAYVRDNFALLGRSVIARQIYRETVRRDLRSRRSQLLPTTKLEGVRKRMRPVEVRTHSGIVVGKATGNYSPCRYGWRARLSSGGHRPTWVGE